MAKTKKPGKNGNARKGNRNGRGRSAPAQEKAFVQDPKCDACEALCCRYIALEIDTPEDQDAFDNLRWYLIHRDVSVYVIDGDWHLCVDVPCRYLDGNRCTIHFEKPLLCQRHDPGECEFANPEFRLDHEFRSWDDLKAYMRKKGLSRFLPEGERRGAKKKVR